MSCVILQGRVIGWLRKEKPPLSLVENPSSHIVTTKNRSECSLHDL